MVIIPNTEHPSWLRDIAFAESSEFLQVFQDCTVDSITFEKGKLRNNDGDGTRWVEEYMFRVLVNDKSLSELFELTAVL
jgi:hypothetical protein